MNTIYTNMDWKATPDYNISKSTAGAPDPKTGIVKCQEGTVARTDELEINFCGDLPEEQAEKIRSYANQTKGVTLVGSVPSEKTYVANVVRHKINGYDKAVSASDGSTFTVRYAYDKENGLYYRSNYLSNMKDSVNGTASRLGETCNLYNLKSDIASYFSTASLHPGDGLAVTHAYQSALKEIEQNIAEGKENPTADLKTTVTINGTKWNFTDLVNTVEKLNKSFSYFDGKVNLDYSDYAKIGVSKAEAKKWAENNLSEDKQNVVSKALDARVDTLILREKEGLDVFRHIWDKPGVKMPEEKAKYYETAVLSASNKEAREKIMSLFEETDYGSPTAVNNTVNKYRSIMSPIYLAFGATNNTLPEYLGSAVNDIYKYISGLFGGKASQEFSFLI